MINGIIKKLPILFVLIFAGKPVIGQVLFLKAGPSFSTMHYENSMAPDDPFYKGITGVDIFAGVSYLKLKFLNLSSGLGYIRKGGVASVELATNTGDSIGMAEIIEKLNYISINTTLHFKVPVRNLLEPYVFAGPRLDYLVSWKETYSFIQFFENEGKLNRISWGLLLGGGINLILERLVVGASFDYYLDFNKLVDNESSAGVSNRLYDRTFAVNALVGFKL